MSRTPRFQLIGVESEIVRWRLLGSNNVSLGLGATDYPGIRECIAAIRRLSENLALTRVELTHDNGIRWRWLLYAGDEPIAMANHAYGRRIEAKRAYDRFAIAVGEATVLGGDGKIADWRSKYRIGS